MKMVLSPDAAEIIRRKKTEYCRFADTNQFHLFDKIALPDATFRFAGPDGNILNENGIVYSWENRQTFCDAFTEALANVQCVSVLGSSCLSFDAVSMAPLSLAEEGQIGHYRHPLWNSQCVRARASL